MKHSWGIHFKEKDMRVKCSMLERYEKLMKRFGQKICRE